MKEEKKTIQEWGEELGIKVLDPDGFDRKNPYLYNELFTEAEYMHGLLLSTVIWDRKTTKIMADYLKDKSE